MYFFFRKTEKQRIESNSYGIKLTTADIGIAQDDVSGPQGAGIIKIPSIEWNHILKNNEKGLNYATDIYIDIKDVELQDSINPKLTIDRIGFYYHEAGYVNLDLDIDSFASSAQFVNWPREFVMGPNEDGVIVIFQFVRESIRLCINYIANGTNEYKRVRLVDDVDSFRNDYGYPKYLFSIKSEHKREIENYDNRLLAVFQYYTGSSIRPIFMYDVIINKLSIDENPDD